MSDFGGSLVWSNGRVLITTASGCPAKCRFCYLDSCGVAKPQEPVFSAHAISHELIADVRFRQGPSGTLVSIGCLGEPLAPHAFNTTIELLELLRGMSNPVQLATRWILRGERLARFLRAAKGCSLSLFHSLSTIRDAHSIEVGTPSLANRKAFMKNCSSEGVPSILYIKPVLPGITVNSAEQFVKLMADVGIRHAVLGPLYTDELIVSQLDPVLGADWTKAVYGTRLHPVSGSYSDFGQENAELVILKTMFEAANISVARHGSELSRIHEDTKS
jgi:DNA repair photolyase